MRRFALILLSLSLVGSATGAQASMSLAQKDGCLSCHAVSQKRIGPAYRDVALKYQGDRTAAARLEAKVKAGGAGSWGRIPMPPNANVSDADIKVLVNWILSGAK